MISFYYKIMDVTGVHARPATKFVSACSKFNSKVTVTVDKTTVDCKSIMGILSLGITQGEKILISISGDDEVEAATELKQVLTDLKVGHEI